MGRDGEKAGAREGERERGREKNKNTIFHFRDPLYRFCNISTSLMVR